MNVIDLIKIDLENKKDLYNRPLINSYVILKKDDKGYYIEYAFKEGAPHDNRCLSWYFSYQEEAYIRNKWTEGMSTEDEKKRLDNIKADRETNVGKIFRLESFTCGGEENPDNQVARAKASYEKYHAYKGIPFIPQDHICKVGCPSKACDWNKDWSYEQPVKCACWTLIDGMTMDEFIENYKISMPVSEVAKLINK